MMLNSFTSFDISVTNHTMTMLTLVLIYMVTLLYMNSYWTTPTNSQLLSMVPHKIMMDLSFSTKSSSLKGTTLMVTTTFMIILPLNLMGLVPWGWAATSHLMTTLALSLPLWLSMIITPLMTSTNASIAHYLPENTLPQLSPFLANIEQISSTIRPLTLAFRLSANISAGHVIMALQAALTSFNISTSMFIMSTMTLLGGMLYMTFEMAICLAQTYVFTLLCLMYSNDYLITSN